MIDQWLNPVRRNPSGFSFDITDLQENLDSAPTHVQLASRMREAYWDTGYLSDLAGTYGWDAVRQQFIQARAGTQMRVRRGDFGEAVADQYLKVVELYHIPVVKLMFKMAANQMLPGTDCIAFKLGNGRFVEVCDVESKVRTSLELSVAGAGQRTEASSGVGLLLSRRVRHTIPLWWCPEIADNRHRAKLPDNQPNIALSEQNGQ